MTGSALRYTQECLLADGFCRICRLNKAHDGEILER